jgi:hypothetical protein
MKLHLAAGVLYDEFGKEKEKAKSINVFFNREHKPEQFIDKINHDNKNFHYARVVALLLESIHAQNDSVRKHSMPSGATLESKVQVPADKEYSKFVAALLDPESRDKFNKFISNIQPAKLTEIDAYNLFSHRCELDVASVKKCWPELSSEYKLSDKEIGKLLLCSKDEADKIIAKVAEKQMNAFQLGNELVDALGGKKVSQSQQAQSASKIINDLSKVKDGMEAIKEQIQQEKTPKREAKL